MTPATPAHLYVHVPFCAHRCGYCDFVTTSASPELHAKYVDALRYEHHHRGLPARYRTIFVGGGTPTLLELPQLRQLLTWLRGMLADGGELTVECNPETVTGELAELLAAYATRVSLGAQSMSEHVLEVLERRATPAHVQAAVQALRAAGVDQLNVDVIWGVPGQTDDDLRRDLRALLALGPDHLSAYELDFKPGTRLTRAWGSREAAVGESSDEMYELVVDELGAAEFDWYETANFARDGCQCRHNRAIWQGEAYAGIGIGAVGTTGEQRRRNKPSLPRYLAAAAAGADAPHDLEQLDHHTVRCERVMLGLRLADGVSIPVAHAAEVLDQSQLDWLVDQRLIDARELEHGALHVRLRREGRFLANEVLGRLLRWEVGAAAPS